MSEQRAFALPDVGEGLTEAEILRWLVRVGDVVEVNDPIVEIETAKASVELPSPFAGVVAALHAEPGALVAVGTAIITIETADAPAAPERQAVLVGYGVREGSAVARRPRRGAAPAGGSVEPPSPWPVPATAVAVRAKPPVRKLARELGIDLATVVPTGPNGEVTRADVVGVGSRPTALPASAPVALPARPDAVAGARLPVRGVQRAMAEAMVRSAFTAPHVTEWVDVDMSRALGVLATVRALPACADVRLTPMVLVAAGLVRAAVRYPLINSSWVEAADGPHIATHADVHLGIAADTPRGLLVPTVRGARDLGLIDLARAVQAAVDTARAGRSTPGDLTGGTITLTNIGVFGIDGGTPILSPGQSAILAMGRILDRPWVVDGALVVRPVMQLSLSFDHRVVDGALGSRALASVVDFLADPALAMLADRVALPPEG